MARFGALNETSIQRAILCVGYDPSIATPPGRVAVNREALRVELGIAPEGVAIIDEALQRLGGEFLALDRPRSLSLTLGPDPRPMPASPTAFFYVVSKQLLIATP